jgi:hypothetical protein
VLPSADPTWTDVAQTILIALQLVVVVAAALFAWSQLTEARGLREDQTRPFVIVDLDSQVRPFFDLVVKNIGTTMAREVKIRFEPELQSSLDDFDPGKLKMFNDGISTFPPGKEIRTLFDSGPQRFNADLPDVYEVTVTYKDARGRKDFEETMHVDFGLYWDRTNIHIHGVHEVAKEVKKIREEIAAWRHQAAS